MAILLKSILQNRTMFQSLMKPQLASYSIISRSLTSSTESDQKPLSILFEEVVGIRPRSEASEVGEEDNELKRRLKELEKTLIELKKSEPEKKKKQKEKISTTPESIEKGQSLYMLFKRDKSDKKDYKVTTSHEKEYKVKTSHENEDVLKVFKELPLEMVSFVKLLHKKGYLNKANFLRGEKLDMGSFDEHYARTFVKFAAEKFGQDHQEIAKWLSGSDLKSIVQFGCPSLDRRVIFSAKTLRKFFDIPENNVCDKCVLKENCKFPNQSVWKGNIKHLHLSVVMKVITLYHLDLTHPKLQVPQEVQDSVSRLLLEIQNLSKTVCTPLV